MDDTQNARDTLTRLNEDGMSWRALGERLSVSHEMARKVANGEKNPSEALVDRIVALDATLDREAAERDRLDDQRDPPSQRPNPDDPRTYITPFAEMAMEGEPLDLLNGAHGLRSTPRSRWTLRSRLGWKLGLALALAIPVVLGYPETTMLAFVILALPYLVATAWAHFFIDSSLDFVSHGGHTIVTGLDWPRVWRPTRVIYHYSGRFEAHKSLHRENLEAAFAQKFPGSSWTSRWRFLIRVITFHRVPALPRGKVPYVRPTWDDWRWLPVGPTAYGTVEHLDLAVKPHTVLSGETGAGKTSTLLVWVAWLLPFVHGVKSTIQTRVKIQLVIADPKRMDFRLLRPLAAVIPGLYYYATVDEILAGLRSLRAEMERRQHWYEEHGTTPWFDIMWVQDEMAELKRRARKTGVEDEINDHVQSLLALGRSVGIRLILSTQQPNVKALAGNSESRDQLGNIVMTDDPDDSALGMLSLKRADIPDISEVGDVAVKKGHVLTVAHAYFLDPTDLLEAAGIDPDDPVLDTGTQGGESDVTLGRGDTVDHETEET